MDDYKPQFTEDYKIVDQNTSDELKPQYTEQYKIPPDSMTQPPLAPPDENESEEE